MLSLTVAGIFLPVMQVEYAGTLKAYLLAFTFGLFGSSVKTLRLTVILVGLLGLIFFVLLAKDIFDKRTALVSISLLSTDPSLILYCRQDWGPVAIAFALRMISLFCFFGWIRGGKAFDLICGFACIGLGVYDKVNFLWFVVGTAATASLVAILERKRPSIRKGPATASGIAVLVTSAPVWIFNIWCHWPILRAGSMYGIFSQSVPERLAILKETLQGTATNAWMFGEVVTSGFSFNATLLWPLFAIAYPFLLIYGIFRPMDRLRFLGLFVLISAMSLQILMTPLLIGPHHWISLYPFPHVAIGLLISETAHIPVRWIQKYGSAKITTAVVLIVLISNLSIFAHHHRLASFTGGSQLERRNLQARRHTQERFSQSADSVDGLGVCQSVVPSIWRKVPSV
jgi:4-amino-4-deoxy-L-arabinose transferase-like glycosyltransferase